MELTLIVWRVRQHGEEDLEFVSPRQKELVGPVFQSHTCAHRLFILVLKVPDKGRQVVLRVDTIARDDRAEGPVGALL